MLALANQLYFHVSYKLTYCTRPIVQMTRLKARKINCKYEKPGKYLVHRTWFSAINDMYCLTFTVITNSKSFIIEEN